MRIVDNTRAVDVKIAYIGGGSRGWAWQLMGDLALEPNVSGVVSLYDIDREAAERNAVIGNRLAGRPDTVGDFTYQACDTLEEALAGADFIIISILPGTMEEMEADVHLPEKYGVYQSVGDTTGPGGIVRALRTGPMFQVIAQAIRDTAPNAWVINYTNPMALCMRVLYDAFPGIRAIGCCHEVFGTQKLLASALNDQRGIEGVSRSALRTTVQGVNHFTWITEAWYQDTDLFPLYRNFAQKYADDGYLEDSSDNWMNSYFKSAQRVKLDLFLRYGFIAAAGDRHLAEFNPSPRYLRDKQLVHDWKFSLTPVAWRKEDLQNRLSRSQKLFDGTEDFTLNRSGEEGVQMIKALAGLGDLVTNVNLPNRGQLGGAPLGTVVETNAVLSPSGFAPVYAGTMHPAILSLSMPAMLAQDMLLAAIRGRRAADAFPAMLTDPLMCTVSANDCRALYSQMLERTVAYLAGWDLTV